MLRLPPRSVTTAAALVSVLALAACSPPPSDTPTGGSGAQASATTGGTDAPSGVRTDEAGNPVGADDVRPTGALTDLPPCDGPPPASGDAPPEGLFLPRGTVVTAVQEIDPVVSVEGWVPMTPSQVRRAFENASGYEVLNREDESYDAEVLVSDGTDRSFVEVLAVCDNASRFLVVTSAEPDQR